jgi:hypothetical protein
MLTIKNRRNLNLKERLTLAKEIEVSWTPFQGTLREYSYVLIEKLNIEGLNYDHIHYTITELDLPVKKDLKQESVLERLVSLEKALASLEARLTAAGA